MVTLKKNTGRFVVFIVVSSMLFLLFCGKDSIFNKPESQEYGQVSPVLLFKKAAKNITVPPGVKSVRMHITGAAVDTSVKVPYSDHHAEMKNIPVGIVQLVVDALDSLDQAMDTGSVLVTISANQVSQPVVNLVSTHPIVLTFTSPKNNDTLASKSVTLSGSITAEYGLLTFTMGQSGLPVDGNQWSKNTDLSTGTNQFVFVAVDIKGNYLKDTLTVFYSATARDLTGPVITLMQPADSSTVPVTPITVTGTATDPSGILAVQVNTKTATLYGSTFSISQDLVPGANRIVVTAIDNSPTQNKSSDTLIVMLNTASKDTTGPLVTINTPKDGDTVAAATVMISGTGLDISGMASVAVNGMTATITGNAWSASIPVSAGPNKIIVIATDASPQHNVSRDTITIVYSATAQDRTLPSVAIASPSNNTVVSNPLNIAITGTASDPAGIASVKVNGLSAAYASGSWNAAVSLSHPGNNSVLAVATDNAGNKDSTSINLVYDSSAADVIPPSITLVSPLKGQTVSVSPVLIQVTVTDANGINGVTINGDTAALNAGKYEKSIPLVNGVNQIKVVAQDKSANRNVDSLKFTLTYNPSAADSIPPQVALVTLTPGQVVSSRTVLVQVIATDANGIAWVTIMGDTAVLNAGKYEKTVTLASGNNTVKVVAQDASSNRNVDSLVFTLDCDTTAADNTPPEITLVSPANGSRVASASQLVQVTVKDQSGIASVTIGGKPASLVADKYQVQVNLNPGSNTINVSAEDASANKNKGQLTFALVYDSTLADSVPPAIRLNAPLSGQTFNKASLQVSATVTDSSGVSSVTINGGTPTSAGNDYTSTLTLVPGQNQITIVAIDASTRRNQKTAAITVFYDPPPESAILAVPSAVTFSSVKLMWSRSQDSDFVSYKVYHSTTPGVTQSDILDTTITNPVYYTCTIYKLLENTTYYFKVFTEDRFPSVTPGNEVSAKTSWITPQVPTLFSPADGAVHTPVPTTLVWNLAADASSYHVQISTSPSFASGNTDSAGITGTSIMFQSPLFNTKYYWHVCAVHGDSSSAWSIARTFSTALAPPSAPTLKSPANGSTVQNSTQKLLWLKPDTTVNGYWVQVSTNSSFSSVDVLDQNSVGAESLMVSGLTSGKTFYWHVRATNPDASSAWSAISSFSVQPLIWTNISAGGSGLTKTDVRSVAVSGGNIFAGTYGGGAFLSGNNGTSWTQINSGLTDTIVWSLAISGSTVFAGTYSSGVFLSSNNGSSWTQVNNGLTNYDVRSFTVSGAKIFTGTYGSGVFLTSDNGANWTAVSSGLPVFPDFSGIISLAVNGNNIFAGTTNNGVFLSGNGGTSWTAVNSGLTDTINVRLAVSGGNIFAATNLSGVFLSSDNGASWTSVHSGLSSSGINALAVSGGTVFAGTWGDGVYLTRDNGTSWTKANTGLTNPNIQSLAVSGSSIVAGTNDGVFSSPLP